MVMFDILENKNESVPQRNLTMRSHSSTKECIASHYYPFLIDNGSHSSMMVRKYCDQCNFADLYHPRHLYRYPDIEYDTFPPCYQYLFWYYQ